MPLQNRVTPFGEIVATPERGTMFGNRGGCFHDDAQRLTRRRWASRQWICCLLEFKGRHREVMQPRRYTELFFLDEATALAAGHRPCFECRREDAEAFRSAWARAAGVIPSAPAMDAALHPERVPPSGYAGPAVDSDGRRKPVFSARLPELPAGAFITEPGSREACLWWNERLWLWSPGGYVRVGRARPEGEMLVLTPRSIMAAIQAGYRPGVHPTAG